MLRTVILHGALADRFGATFSLDVRKPVEALRALMVQLPGFRQALREGHYKIIKARERVADTLGLEELQLRFGRAAELHVVPVIAGSASTWGKILAGVAIVGLAIAAPYALGLAGGLSAGITFGSTTVLTFGQIASFGAVVALGGIAQMLSPTPSTAGNTPADRRDSFLFGSSDNVTAEGGPVPLVFGDFIVGSVVVSAGLSAEELGSSAGPNYGVILRDWWGSKSR